MKITARKKQLPRFKASFQTNGAISFVLGIALCLSFGCTEATLDFEEDPIELGDVLYDPDVKSIMTVNCTGCHGGSNPIAGFVLTNYINVQDYTQNKNLIDRIEDLSNPMPPNGLMSSEDRQKIQKWADDGYPEN